MEQSISRLFGIYNLLSDDQKKAAYWFINNFEIIEELSKTEKISENDMNDFIEIAKSKNDYMTLLLLFYKQLIDKNSSVDN